MTPLATAIERKQWPLVSLQLLLAVSACAAKLPPESLTALMDLLGGLPEEETDGRRGA